MTQSRLDTSTLWGRKPPVLDGYVHPSFGPVADALGQMLSSYGGGGGVCIYHHGECVVDVWGGVKDKAGNAWERDTMSPSFSTTKGVASTLLHVLVDRGLLDYDDRVADHWPEFAQAGKDEITVRQILAHQSGLYHIRQMIDHADRMRDWSHVVRAIERAEPAHEPGTRTGYHGLTFGFLVGELIQRITGESFSKLVQSEIASPLDLDGFYVGAPRNVWPRVAELMWPRFPMTRWIDPTDRVVGRLAALMSRLAGGVHPIARLAGIELDLESLLDALAPRGISAFDFGSRETLSKTIPSANGLFTARALARMYAALAEGGAIDGVRLLSRRTLSRATEVQPPASRRAVIPFDMGWRLGYHGVATSRGVVRRAYGHFGFGGSGAWAEPNRRLSVALIVNSGMGTPFGDLRIIRIGGAALTCADAHRPKASPPASQTTGAMRSQSARARKSRPRKGGRVSVRRRAVSGQRSR